MHSSWLTCEADAWARTLTRLHHDVFHRPAYARLAARQEGGKGGALLVEDDADILLVPLLIKPLRDAAGTECDAASPYGYPGPLLAASTDTFLPRALDAGLLLLRERGIASLFVRMHPLLPIPTVPLIQRGTLIHHGDTVSIDLTESDAGWWRQLRSSTRYDIRKARRAGLVAAHDPSWRHLNDFVAIYHETMARVGADPSYVFDTPYFERLREGLGKALHLHVVCENTNVLAAALFTEAHGIVQYFLAGTRTAALNRHPMKLLLDHARRWAKAQEHAVLHLGGGVGGQEDALFDFKAGFSPRRHPFHTWRVVVAPERFATLCRRAGVDATRLEGFFPPYRAPAR